jgi:heme/copper-type cytochrome/quinol oxidase subunit 2
MFNRMVRTIFVLVFTFAVFFAWWAYAAHVRGPDEGREHMFNRMVWTIFVLVFTFAVFFAWWTYAAHAMCFENQLGDTCFYLNQMERAQQMEQGVVSSPVAKAESPAAEPGYFPSEEIQCQRERDIHERLDIWATAADRGKKWPATPWCEKYERTK